MAGNSMYSYIHRCDDTSILLQSLHYSLHTIPSHSMSSQQRRISLTTVLMIRNWETRSKTKMEVGRSNPQIVSDVQCKLESGYLPILHIIILTSWPGWISPVRDTFTPLSLAILSPSTTSSANEDSLCQTKPAWEWKVN